MQKSISMLVAVIAIGLTMCTQKQEAFLPVSFVAERYVLFLNPDSVPPLVIDTSFYSKIDQQQKRFDTKARVQQILHKNYHLTVDTSQIFVDVAVAVVATMNSQKADSIRKDSTIINSLARDVRIQGRPIQQSLPVIQGRPIQQVESVAAGWELTNRHGCWFSCAADKAGGAIDGSTRRAKIWVVDTGIALDNPFLNVDTQYARNFTVTPSNGNAYDDNGHGTAVAGAAASMKIKLNSTISVCASVSPGARVVPIKVLDATGGGDWSNILHALDYIVAKGRRGDVINMSLGDYPITNCRTEIPGLETALVNAAIKYFVVVAAGNDANDVMRTVPGCINGPDGTKIFTVASASCGNQCEYFSNYGSSVDWLAASRVFTTYLKDPASGDWTFIAASGTSISSGVISGLIHSTGRAPKKGGSVSCRVLPITPGTPAIAYYFGTR